MELKREIKKLKPETISIELKDEPFFLYGAGYTAKVCLGVLEDAGLTIEALIDDDSMKQGSFRGEGNYCVLSYEELVEICRLRKNVNVILTSIYGKSIYNKLLNIPNVLVWEMYEWYTDLLNQQEIVIEKYCKGEELKQYKDKTDALKKYLQDQESKEVFDGIYQYFKTNNINYLAGICTTEESYFIKEVKEHFQNKSFTLVDAGAYEGELLRAITESALKVKKWYCFEMEQNNFERLKNNIKMCCLPEGMTCVYENYGLWKEKNRLPVISQGTCSKISELKQDDTDDLRTKTCQFVTIDDYFKNIKVDMIKMDIEGAEMEALSGGIRTIQRDRPVLAISIYHYVKDYYRIMQFLLKSVEGYRYYIRQHAMIYGETVLYAIPEG